MITDPSEELGITPDNSEGIARGSGAPPILTAADERIYRAIDLAQRRFRTVADLGVKGIIFHLGISAFSLTFGFQTDGLSIPMIVVANVLVTLLALFATVAITKDAQRARLRIIEWHRDFHAEIDPDELQGLITTARLYAVFCSVVLVFWIAMLVIQPFGAA